MDKRILLRKLPDHILSLLPKDEDERLARISKLPELSETNPRGVAVGDVFKISIMGDITKDRAEYAYLYLCAGASIVQHPHWKYREVYELYSGPELSVMGEKGKIFTCDKFDDNDGIHRIDPVKEDTIVKSSKTLLSEKDIELAMKRNRGEPYPLA
ncbi:MAG: hypothetical protein FWD89_01175 [Firmicutes bacterium]|nr:hypothetical protein [Bacillota bacterium]MCL2770903.1 hypothetical protein [Bacillota bacterium]